MMSSLKLIFVLCVVCLVAHSESRLTDSTRDFLSSYLGILRGKEFKLDDDCLSGEFDTYLKQFEIALFERNILMIISKLKEMISFESNKCPFDETAIVFKDLKTAMKNGMFLMNTMKHMGLIKMEFEEFFKSPKTMKNVGKYVGSITKIAIYGTSYTTYQK